MLKGRRCGGCGSQDRGVVEYLMVLMLLLFVVMFMVEEEFEDMIDIVSLDQFRKSLRKKSMLH